MNWGKSIVLVFILFAAFIGTLVYVCVTQDISLVSGTYYEDELAYGKHMDKIRNAASLADKPLFRVSGDSLKISFKHFASISTGRLTLFRPSNAQWDRTFAIMKDAGDDRGFLIRDLAPGMYKAKLEWSMGDKDYYMEEIINR